MSAEAESSGGHSVEIAPEHVLEIGEFAVPNTMTGTLLVSFFIIVFALLVRRKAGIIPTRLQVLFESLFVFFLDKLEEGLGEKRARKLVPLVMTLFMFILVSNQLILIPLVGSITSPHGPFFRTPTTDYSATIALAISVVVLSHVLALFVSPLGHIGNYFRVAGFFDILRRKRPPGDLLTVFIEFFLGLLEIIGDLGKIVSLATRLFGNIFAGEAVIIIISGLLFVTQFFVPIPFIVLASFAGLIQAFVFSLLTILFISNNIVHASHQAERSEAH